VQGKRGRGPNTTRGAPSRRKKARRFPSLTGGGARECVVKANSWKERGGLGKGSKGEAESFSKRAYVSKEEGTPECRQPPPLCIPLQGKKSRNYTKGVSPLGGQGSYGSNSARWEGYPTSPSELAHRKEHMEEGLYKKKIPGTTRTRRLYPLGKLRLRDKKKQQVPSGRSSGDRLGSERGIRGFSREAAMPLKHGAERRGTSAWLGKGRRAWKERKVVIASIPVQTKDRNARTRRRGVVSGKSTAARRRRSLRRKVTRLEKRKPCSIMSRHSGRRGRSSEN